MTTRTDVRAVAAIDPAIRVLIIDDSAVAREVLTTILRRDGFTVVTAPSAETAMQRIVQHRPDVVLLDLQLPGESGLVFLERLMRTAPLPVIVCSGIAQSGTAAAIRALELGAVEVLPKPALGIRALLGSSEIALDEVVRAAAAANTNRPLARPSVLHMDDRHSRPIAAGVTPWFGKVVLIGASTGGTEAIRTIVARMPADAAPIVIVQHMPGAFTRAFAQRLNAYAAVEVREAEDGDVLSTGVALVAPGGRHLELARAGSVVRVRVTDGPTVSGHRPSVDVLFHSAARALTDRAIGVLLTGMGADGAEGMLQLRTQGAHTIAQDESTSVVYGMPREAALRGAVCQILPLDRIAGAIVDAGTT
jgi:two-component system, chemotaxis family, protein-glutamate methylesterase/glutaminase